MTEANGFRSGLKVVFGTIPNEFDQAMLTYFNANQGLWNKWIKKKELIVSMKKIKQPDKFARKYLRRTYEKCSLRFKTTDDMSSLDLRNHEGLIYMQTPIPQPIPKTKTKKTKETRSMEHYYCYNGTNPKPETA
tara:strand:+ start:193 stop:594 length:402 start_codon:yes stop_codon:yes gene_type:complete